MTIQGAPQQQQQPRYHKTEKTLNKTQRQALGILPVRRKQAIPHALKWQIWIRYAGENFKAKCSVPWCLNIMKASDFQAGHKKAEAVGGTTTLDNLIPICSTCNLSMGTEHFDDWARRGPPVKRCCFSLRWLWRTLRASWPVYPRVTHQPSSILQQQPAPRNADDKPAYTYPPPQPPLANLFVENV